VLHEYWSSHLFPGDAAESTLTLASTLSTGLLFFSGAPLGPLFTAFPWYEKHFQVAGLVIAVGGLIGSAFATQPWHLVLTFGILYPCSAATYMPCATNIFEWFQERRGLATGIMYAGTGTGGALYPIITTALLNRFGYKATMIALALSFAVLNLAALPFIRRRIPLAKHLNGASKRRMRPKVDFSFLKTRAAWIAFTFMTVTSLANFIPLLWIPCKCALKTARPPLVPVTDLCSSVRNRHQRSATQRRRPRLRHQRNHGRRQRPQRLPVRPHPVAHHRYAVDGDCGPVMCRPVGVRHQRRRTHGLCRRVGYHGRQSGGLLG
jgi:MFS family permease